MARKRKIAQTSNPQTIKSVKSVVEFKAKNFTQHRILKSLKENKILFTIGAAGTGKTYIAARYAITEFLQGRVDKIVITRPTVTVGEDIGFLPGNVNEKMEPWFLPFRDIFLEEGGLEPFELRNLIAKGCIEICPMQYARGRTFRNCILIADEMQNSEIEQLKMLLTRIGENSQFIINGDIKQSDRTKASKSGIADFIDRMEGKTIPGIDIIKFDDSEIVRHPLISPILELYDE